MTVDRSATREVPNLSYGAVKIKHPSGRADSLGKWGHGSGTVACEEYEDARPGRRSEKAGPMVRIRFPPAESPANSKARPLRPVSLRSYAARCD
jgi:hypothetical protein